MGVQALVDYEQCLLDLQGQLVVRLAELIDLVGNRLVVHV